MTKFIVLSLILGSLAANAQMTHEETVVRTAYAKYAYGVAQGVITDLAMEAMSPTRAARTAMRNGALTSEQRLTAGTITFLLSDFTFGNLRDIMNRDTTDFVTPYGGDVLQAVTLNNNYGTQKANREAIRWTSFKVSWETVTPADNTLLTMTFSELQREMKKENQTLGAPSDRYASYTVAISYQGKARAYKAMFLFGRDEQGNEVVRPHDPIADDTGLGTALAKPLFPEGLTRTKLRAQTVVQDWLNQNQMADSACTTLLGNGDACCDLARLRCGPGRAELSEALAKPIEETTEKGKE